MVTRTHRIWVILKIFRRLDTWVTLYLYFIKKKGHLTLFSIVRLNDPPPPNWMLHEFTCINNSKSLESTFIKYTFTLEYYNRVRLTLLKETLSYSG